VLQCTALVTPEPLPPSGAKMAKIRRGLLIFLLINILIIGLLVRSVFTLITLLFEDGARDAILRAEIPAPNSELIEQKPRFIPKIIHQTYVNESIPEHWREAQQSCLDYHMDYEYKVSVE
jgi:inositol phosphorylceramide mannosyltransferase catalytic subunit